MSTAEIGLEQVLRFRDERENVQRELIREFGLPMISFTMNIAGPVKRSPLIDFAFDEALKEIILRMGTPVYRRKIQCDAGNAAFLVYDADADQLKKTGIDIEERSELGRLLDIDVIDVNMVKLSRPNERKCLICGGPVLLCSRSRAHSIHELSEKTAAILSEYASETIAAHAVRALEDEALLTPKPGLVDAHDSGAHADMDVELMLRSARSLYPYFKAAAKSGMEAEKGFPALLQEAGKQAEKQMLAVTGGVNTHKGAVYQLGLLCAAKGISPTADADTVCETAAHLADELAPPAAASHGSDVRQFFPKAGPRYEAISSFPHVRKAVRQMRDGWPTADVLLELIAEIDDSNVLWRGGADGLNFLQKSASAILSAPADKHSAMISELNEECILRNISPGGAADLLADALFLYSFD